MRHTLSELQEHLDVVLAEIDRANRGESELPRERLEREADETRDRIYAARRAHALKVAENPANLEGPIMDDTTTTTRKARTVVHERAGARWLPVPGVQRRRPS